MSKTYIWADHFALNGVRIDTLTDIGEVTARILDFNNVDRLIERQELQTLGEQRKTEFLGETRFLLRDFLT